MLKFSLPLILGSISGVLLITFDRYTLNYLASLPDVGVYTLGYRIANTIKILVIVSVQLALSPILFKMMDQPDSKRFYSKIMTYFSYLVILAVMFLSFFSLEIVKVFTASVKYWDAAKVIPVISFALFFGMLKDTSLIGLQIIKKTKIIGTIIFLVAILNLLLNILLIPRYTIMGASVATLISQIIFFIVIFIYAQKHYYIPYELLKIAKMTFLALVLYGLSLLSSDLNLGLRLVIKSMLIFSFPFLLYPLGFYEKIELNRLGGAWRKWRNPTKWKENLKKMNNTGLSK
jgi:O-antigen/teichoic acid export membrane protein